jgi:hypothetical protein
MVRYKYKVQFKVRYKYKVQFKVRYMVRYMILLKIGCKISDSKMGTIDLAHE